MNFVSKTIKNLVNSWKTLYLAVLVFFIISYCYGFTWHNIRSIFVLTFTYLLSFYAFLIFFLHSRSSVDVFNQIFVVYFFAAVFYDASFFSPYVEKTYMINNVIGIISINIPLLVMIIYFFYEGKLFNKLQIGIKNNWGLILIIALYLVLSLETINSMTRLDTNIYYTYLQDAKFWNLSFDTVMNFKLGGHQSIGYTVWALIGVYLTPDSPAGIRLVNIFLVCISILALYSVYIKIFPLKSKILTYLAVAFFAFNPLILGIIYEINLDLPLVCFYIWTIYSIMYNKQIFLLVSSFLLVFSKETGILLLFGCVLGWMCIQFYEIYSQKALKIWYKIFSFKTAFILCFSPALLLLSMLFTPLWRQDSLHVNNQSVQSMDSFGFNLENTSIKIKELFILNFSWILVILVVIGLGILFFNKKRKLYDREKIIQILPLLISWLIFLVFQFVYITYCHIRYITPYLPMFIAAFFIILNLYINKKVEIILATCCLCLIIIQNFYTLDFVSRNVCNLIDIGKSELITTRTFVRSSENTIQTKKTDPLLINELQQTQSAIYNRQYLYFLSAFEKFLEEIQYDENTYIAVAPIYEKGGEGMTWISLFGRWYSNELFYDENTNKCVDNPSKTKLNISVISDNRDINYDNYERIYLITFPYNKLFDNKEYLEQFKTISSFTVSEKLWEIYVYQLK